MWLFDNINSTSRFFLKRIIFIAIVFSACRDKVKDQHVRKVNNDSKIRNGIVISATNINVEEAFLAFDDGHKVPEENNVKVHQKIWLRLITSGWKKKDSAVFFSGRETVTTSTGLTIMDNRDLFDDFENGFSGEEPQTIGISLVITELTKHFDYFKVSFKIKDEIDPRNTVEGYYKLHPY